MKKPQQKNTIKEAQLRSLVRQEIRKSLKEGRPDDWMHGGHPGEAPDIPNFSGNDSKDSEGAGQDTKGGVMSLKLAFTDIVKRWQTLTKNIDNSEAQAMSAILNTLMSAADSGTVSAKLSTIAKALQTQLQPK